eukprot:jgi/Galph1/5995/GphlegSOOS_G4597.1
MSLKLDVSHSKRPQVFQQVRFQPEWTLEKVKQKLEIVTGTLHSDFYVEVHNDRGEKIGEMVDDQKASLGSLPICSGFRLHIVDNNPDERPEDKIWNDDENKDVAKFDISETQYEQRPVSGRRFREQMLSTPGSRNKRKVGDRCLVTPDNRLGTIRYIGPVEGKDETVEFIGVEFEEPVGKNDGSFQDRRYFHCNPSYGSFVPVARVVKIDTAEHSTNLNARLEEL